MYSLILKDELQSKKVKKLKNKKYNIFYYLSIISIIIFLLAYYLYILSLEKCMEGQIECGKKIHWIKKKINQSILCSIILGILIEFMLLQLISKVHLIHFFLFFFFIFNYSHGEDFDDHGLYNLLGCIILIITSIIILSPFNFILYLIKKNNYKIVIIFILILIIISFHFKYLIKIYLNCNDWPNGLNNTYIENNINKYGCKIIMPKFCPYKLGQFFLDISKISRVKCGNDFNTKKKLLDFSNSKYINSNTSRFGYPLINKYIKSDNQSKENIEIFIKRNLVDMDNKEQLKKIGKENIPEIIVDFSENPNGKIIINLKFNKTLSKERNEKEKNSNPYSKNIIILYIDSLSRSTSIRQLKKTTKFFENFMSVKGNNNPNYPLENFHSFQFFKYVAFFNFTRGNFPKIFFGNDNPKRMIRITKYLKKNGYITAFSNDMCLRSPCIMPKDLKTDEICDYEFILCDPNMKNTNSMIKKCLYDKLNIEYQYEYGLQFWKKYKNNRKFLAIINNDGHEGTLEIIKYDDEIIFNFLNTLFQNNLLKETTILLLSDHGCPMPSLYHFTNFYRIDRYLPMLFLFTYDRENISYNEQYKNIRENQQILITSYDIYNTIGFLIYGNDYRKIKNKTNKIDTPKTKYGESLFNKINPKKNPYNYKNMPKSICQTYKKYIK